MTSKRYLWAGWTYEWSDDQRRHEWRAEEPPVAGDTAWWSDFEDEAGDRVRRSPDQPGEQLVPYTVHGPHPHTRTYVEIPSTCSGDYVGSDYQASNRRSLLRDYPDTFIIVRADYSTETLFIAEDDLTDDIREIIEALEDDPIYDEQDHSELVDEWAYEAWDLWAGSDVQHTVRTVLEDGAETFTDILDEWADDGRLRQEFCRLVWTADAYPYCEGYGEQNIVFPRQDEHCSEIARLIILSRMPEYAARLIASHPHSAGQIAFDGGESA